MGGSWHCGWGMDRARSVVVGCPVAGALSARPESTQPGFGAVAGRRRPTRPE